MRMLDLFCGRFGWSRAFAARGWECFGVDLTPPPEIPQGCEFIAYDVLLIGYEWLRFLYGPFDFICASPPCEQFSVHGMKHFHPNPPYPELGIKLFRHTRRLCEDSGVPYVIENVRAAQQFVGRAVHHCGPFYLWGNGVPPLVNQGIKKGLKMHIDGNGDREWRNVLGRRTWSGTDARLVDKAIAAIIPPELANCVADFAERICEKAVSRG
jgi:hypothetical protein